MSDRPLGCVLTEVDEHARNGLAVLVSYQTDAYGAVSPTPANADPYVGLGAQQGYYRDPETGFQLCTYRYYDPLEGRWLTPDPIGKAGGINLYGYVGGNPVGGTDPSGLASIVTYGPVPGPLGTYLYEHRYLLLGEPCAGEKSYGFWPDLDRPVTIPVGVSSGAPNASPNLQPPVQAPIWVAYHGTLKSPDPHDSIAYADDKGVRRHFRNNNDPRFERALRECIREWKRTNPDGGVYFLGYGCGSWADEMWSCAKRKLGWR